MSQPQVTVVNSYDSKSGLYIDGKLVWEEQYLTVRKVLEKIAATGAISLQFKSCEKESFNEVGQYPATLNQVKFKQ